MKGLYAIVDTDACTERGLSPLQVARGVLAARPPTLQLRAKGLEPRDELHLLKALRAITPPATLLFGNDRPDVALLAKCDGVHLGQSDLPIEETRRFAPELRVGLSTHNLEQVKAALLKGPDYVAFGPVFQTGSKKLAEPEVGLGLLASAYSLCGAAGVPLVAIGGIDECRLPDVAVSADQVAFISALLPANGTPRSAESSTDAVTRRAARLIQILERAAPRI